MPSLSLHQSYQKKFSGACFALNEADMWQMWVQQTKQEKRGDEDPLVWQEHPNQYHYSASEPPCVWDGIAFTHQHYTSAPPPTLNSGSSANLVTSTPVGFPLQCSDKESWVPGHAWLHEPLTYLNQELYYMSPELSTSGDLMESGTFDFQPPTRPRVLQCISYTLLRTVVPVLSWGTVPN